MSSLPGEGWTTPRWLPRQTDGNKKSKSTTKSTRYKKAKENDWSKTLIHIDLWERMQDRSSLIASSSLHGILYALFSTLLLLSCCSPVSTHALPDCAFIVPVPRLALVSTLTLYYQFPPTFYSQFPLSPPTLTSLSLSTLIFHSRLPLSLSTPTFHSHFQLSRGGPRNKNSIFR